MNSREEYRPWGECVRDLFDGHVAFAKLVLIDVRVVDAVDVQSLQVRVIDFAVAAVVVEPEAFEEILIDDDCTGGNNCVDHGVANHVDDDAFQPRTHKRACEAQDDAAVLIRKHPVVNLAGAREVACLERHVVERVDERHRVEGFDVDVLDFR